MAKDKFHDIVAIALQKEGWQITHDPLYINIAEVEVIQEVIVQWKL